MINKIIASYLMFALLVAIALKLGGVDSTIHFGNYFRAYLVQTNKDLLDFKIAIPDIPIIEHFHELTAEEPMYLSNAWDYLRYAWNTALSNSRLLNAANSVIDFINFIINVLNVIINVINVIIQVVEMLIIFIKNLLTMKDNIIANT